MAPSTAWVCCRSPCASNGWRHQYRIRLDQRPARERGDTDGGALLPGEVLGEGFTILGAGGKLSVKNGTTSREMILEGPGDVRACVDGEEEAWIVTRGPGQDYCSAEEAVGKQVEITNSNGSRHF